MSQDETVRPGTPRDGGLQQFSGRVLLAEDVLANQLVAAKMLKRFGVEVEVAGNGQEALEKWRQGGFGLILMDCQMPVLDGYQATMRLRQEESGGRVPVIALTANAFADNRQRCLDAGMDDFISKPFEMQRLAAILEQWLTPGAAGAPGPLDLDALEQMRAMLEEDFGGFLVAYLESLEQILAQLALAQVTGDAREVERLAHGLKSASLNAGARVLADLCAELEERARQGRIPPEAEGLGRIQAEAARVQQALGAYG